MCEGESYISCAVNVAFITSVFEQPKTRMWIKVIKYIFSSWNTCAQCTILGETSGSVIYLCHGAAHYKYPFLLKPLRK